MPVHTVRCPECRASLKSSKPIPAGKLLTCPKCDVLFAAPEPVMDVEVVEDVEVIDDVEVVDDDAPARKPARKPAAAATSSRVNAGIEVVEDDEDDEPRPKSKKRKGEFRPKRKSGGSKVVLIALACLLGLAGLVAIVDLAMLGGALTWWLMGGKGEEPVAYLPPNAPIVGGVRLGAIAKEVPALAQLLDRGYAAAGASFGKDQTGVEPRDLFDYICFGVGLNGPASSATVVATSRVPFDRSKMMSSAQSSQATAHGQTYLKAKNPGGPPVTYLPNNRNLVMSSLSEADLSPILRSNGKTIGLSGTMATLAQRISSNHIWAVVVMDDNIRSQFTTGPAAAMIAGMPGGQQAAQAYQQAQAFAFWASVAAGKADCHFGMECGSAVTAQQVLDSMKASNAQGQAMPLPVPSLKALSEEVAQSMKYEVKDSMAEMSFSFSVSALEAVINDASKLAPLLGGIPGLGGLGGAPQGGQPGNDEPKGQPDDRGKGGRGQGGGGGKGGGRGKGKGGG